MAKVAGFVAIVRDREDVRLVVDEADIARHLEGGEALFAVVEQRLQREGGGVDARLQLEIGLDLLLAQRIGHGNDCGLLDLRQFFQHRLHLPGGDVFASGGPCP